MGQKVHPTGFRLGVIRTWNSKWFQKKSYTAWLHEDLKLRRFLETGLLKLKEFRGHDQKSLGISRVLIERNGNKLKITLHTARPGILIGKRGQGAEKIKQALQKMTDSDVFLNVQEARKAETNSQLVAENIATQLERRVSFRRAMKKSLGTAMKFGAKGIRVACAGRLGGAEMSRREWYREGRVPLHTLRADIDYGEAVARTTYGTIGVKVWIYNGEVLG